MDPTTSSNFQAKHLALVEASKPLPQRLVGNNGPVFPLASPPQGRDAYTTAMCGPLDTVPGNTCSHTELSYRLPVILLPTQKTHKHTTKSFIPSAQSAGAQPEAEHLSPVALLLLDVRPIFLPSLPSENTQVAGQGLCAIIKTVVLKILLPNCWNSCSMQT